VGENAPLNVSLWQEFLHARHTLSSPHRLLGPFSSNLAAPPNYFPGPLQFQGLHVTLWRGGSLGLDNCWRQNLTMVRELGRVHQRRQIERVNDGETSFGAEEMCCGAAQCVGERVKLCTTCSVGRARKERKVSAACSSRRFGDK
jgi:hypothetical protein